MKESTRQALSEISNLPGEFKKLADAAKLEVTQMKADDLDRKLDELEFLLKRGKYLCLRSIG